MEWHEIAEVYDEITALAQKNINELRQLALQLEASNKVMREKLEFEMLMQGNGYKREDAQLIASAPELLEACHAAELVLLQMERDEKAENALHEIHLAIKKAEGL